ncbi:MAG: SufD family Fe-S cluster assembly protein [Nanoarchaeota archaeon]|nr:SufD family Fe-S cluster assembly protein [Nanoarchaeota archaeon]
MLKAIESKSQEQQIRDLSSHNNEPGWMLQKRLAAFDVFNSKQMPDFVYGSNIKMDIGLDFGKIDADLNKTNIKISNSNKNIIIENFSDALKNHESILKEKLMSIVPAADKFTAFHNAFFNNLTFVYVPENTDAKEPIELVYEIGSDSIEHLIVLVEDNSKITLVENSKSSSNNKEFNENNPIKNNNLINRKNSNSTNNNSNENNIFRSRIVEIFIGKNSIVNYEDAQLLNKNSFNFSVKRASVGADSAISWMDCCIGSKTTLSEVTTMLNGCGASAKNYGMFFGSNRQQFGLSARSIHNAPKTFSDILTKGALAGSGKCIYRGLVKIGRNALGSEGHQKEDALLLSANAAASSIPNLEIDNNEVKCTHGASIGRIDREKLFYMMSRGLSEKQSEKEYVKGFFEELMKKIQTMGIRESINKIIEERIG